MPDRVFDRRSFKHGQIVRNADGKRLGIIAVCGDEKLYLKKTGLSHHLFAVGYAQVQGIIGGDVKLLPGQEHLEDLGESPIPEKMVTNVKPVWPPAFEGKH